MSGPFGANKVYAVVAYSGDDWEPMTFYWDSDDATEAAEYYNKMLDEHDSVKDIVFEDVPFDEPDRFESEMVPVASSFEPHQITPTEDEDPDEPEQSVDQSHLTAEVAD